MSGKAGQKDEKTPGPDGADDLERALGAQLDAISREEVPERLLELARELQALLRRRESGGD